MRAPDEPALRMTTLRDFARYVRDEHLVEAAAENLRHARELGVPLMRFLEGLPPTELRGLSEASLDRFLTALAAGTALENVEASMRAWREDEMPGVPRDGISADDLVLVAAAQERTLLGFVERFAPDAKAAIAIVRELREHYVAAQRLQLGQLLALRDEAAARSHVLEAEVHRRNAEIERQRAFLERLVGAVPTGIAYLDKALVFRWVNAAFAAFASKRPDDFVDRSYYEVFPTMENPNPRLLRVLETGETQRIAGLPIRLASGEMSYWDIVYVPVFEPDGTIEGLMLLSQNATARVQGERLQAEQIERLRAIDRLKDEFLGILSHELRTPINAIMGFASIIEDEIGGPLTAEQARYVHQILQSSDELLALIDDLLDMSRIQAGRFSLHPEEADFATVARRAVGGLGSLAEQKRQTITLQLAPELPTLVADSQRLAQVLVNLIGNAIKFSPNGGAIIVHAERRGDCLRVEVRDEGIGIAPEDRPRVFEPFTQVDSSQTRSSGGTGLGLSISKALVEAHGGTIGVVSAAGAGATFWFELPLSGPPQLA